MPTWCRRNIGSGLLPLLLLAPLTAPAAEDPGRPAVSAAADSLVPDSLTWCRSRVARLEENFLELLQECDPVGATSLGLHAGDHTLGPAGKTGVKLRRERWMHFGSVLEAFRDSVTHVDDRFDVALMMHETHRRLFDLDTLRTFSRDPQAPLGVVSTGVSGLLRGYAPPKVRAAAVVSRLLETPVYLQKSYGLLDRPPRMLVEAAMAKADGLAQSFLHDLPLELGSGLDSTQVAELDHAIDVSVKALWQFREMLFTEKLPGAPQDISLGPELFRRYLYAAEGISTPPDSLIRQADRELERLEVRFREAAAAIDPDRTPEEVVREVGADHPAPDRILTFMAQAVEEARVFMERDGVFPLPRSGPLQVEPTPYLSRMANAALSVPGPFETKLLPGYLYVTLPDPSADRKQQEERLRFLNRPLLRNLAVHEAYPGHWLQASALREVRRPARRVVWGRAFVEGWAHYAEEVMVERGFHKKDPAFELMTLQSALRRAGRFRVSLGIHAQGWTIEEGARFLEEKAYLEPTLARLEAERGVLDPLYLVYTVGKLEMLRLRKDVEKREGDQFDLLRFHRQVLALGSPPLSLARARLLTPRSLSSWLLD